MEPAQIGELDVAVGAAGVALTVTVVDPATLLHPLTVAVTVYVPAAARVILVIDGFCNVLENAFGPVQV